MSNSSFKGEKPVFTLLPPHFHNGWVFKYLIEELDALGYQAHAPYLEISDPNMTRDEHAAVVLKAEEEFGAENYIRAGASWSGDLTYRKIGSNVSKIVLMGAPLRPILGHQGVPKLIPNLANNPTLPYAAFLKGGREFDRHELGKIFYKRIGSQAIRAWAIENLEPHPHIHEDPASDENAVLPSDIEMHYIGFYHDEILPYDNQQRTANFFGINFIPMPTGHFGMLENPGLLAKALTQAASGNINNEMWSDLVKAERLKRLESNPIVVNDY